MCRTFTFTFTMSYEKCCRTWKCQRSASQPSSGRIEVGQEDIHLTRRGQLLQWSTLLVMLNIYSPRSTCLHLPPLFFHLLSPPHFQPSEPDHRHIKKLPWQSTPHLSKNKVQCYYLIRTAMNSALTPDAIRLSLWSCYYCHRSSNHSWSSS